MLTEADASSAAQGSFRDPGGRLYCLHGRILREVEPSYSASLEAFLGTRTAREAIGRGTLVRSERILDGELPELGSLNALRNVLERGECGSVPLLLEHEGIALPSVSFA